MPDAERLTDERVREIAEDGEVYIEPLAESDFGRGVGHENWPSKEAVALAREVLAARAGDREEREGLAAAVGRASMQPGIGHYCADGFEGALKRYREAVLAYRAAPGGEQNGEQG